MKKKIDENKIVGSFFNFSISRKTLKEFANMAKSMSDPEVIDRPDTDVKDLGDARKELLRIMKLAGQSDTQGKPGGWNLVLYNDPVTPGHAVTDGLRSVMGFDNAAISRVIHECITKQHSVLGVYMIEDKAIKLRDALKQAIDNNDRYIGGNGTRGPWDIRIEVLKAGS